MTEKNVCHSNNDLEKKPLPFEDPFFKTYDCRGRYGTEATEEKSFWLGSACNAFKRPLIVGMDFREHNDTLLSAFLQGFKGPVRFAGHMPSPALSFNSKTAWAVSFTASHNPAGYNGVKFKKHRRCFFENELSALKQWYAFSKKRPFSFRNNPLPETDERIKTDSLQSLPEIRGGV